MSPMKLNRRSLLRGMLGGTAVAVGLPPLEIFLNGNGTKDASGSAIPKRFGLFFWGNGVYPDAWVPTSEGADYVLPELLVPLARVKADVTVVSGTKVMLPNLEPHISGAAGILSGAPILKFDDENKTFTAPSIDQLVAAELGRTTRFRSLEYGAKPGKGKSYNGPNNRNPPENSPREFYDRLFGEGFTPPGSDPKPDPTLGLRRSVLDAVLDDAASLKGRLGANDRRRIDQHMEGIRALENRLRLIEENPPRLEACAVPARPPARFPLLDGRPQLSLINRAFVDVAALAVACDQTRVFSNYFTDSVSNNLFPGTTSGHHQLTHDELGDQPQVRSIVTQVMAEFAYLVERLRSIPEGDGTLLDHCVVVGTTDCSLGRTHALDEFPLLLAGTAGGVLKKGIHHRSATAENASKAMLTVLRALDVPAAEFGQAEGRATETMEGLLS
jgi:hypothetical protein